MGFLVELFEANTKSSSGISGVLNEYYETVKGIDTTTQDIFGEGNPSKLSMLQKAFLEYSSQTPEDLRLRKIEDELPKNLIVTHNLTAKKLEMVDDIGGLAMPSLGVRRVDVATGEFGEISLIAPKSILRDKAAKTYQGDMWSPTYPTRKFVAKKGEAERVINLLQKRYEKAGLDFKSLEGTIYYLFQNNNDLRSVIPHLKELYEAETGENDFYSDTKWTKQLEETLDVQGEYKLVAGYTNLGRPKLIPETLDNAIKLMKKEALRGDAGVFQNVSSLKAKLIKKLNIKQMSANRDSIKDMQTVHADRRKFVDELSTLVEKLENVGKYLEKHKDENPYTVLDRHATHIHEMALEGFDSINRDFYDGKLSNELKTEIEDFFKRLANSSVPYFESKITRGMRLSEFVGAVIPQDASERVREILKKNGIKYREYATTAERDRVTDEFTRELDENGLDIRWREDTVLMPIDINVLVARNIDALMNAIRKSHKSILAKEAELEKKYPSDDENRNSKIQNDLRLYILENFSSELVPIAKLSDEDFKFYRKQFGIRDKFVYTSFGYAIEHYFNRHPDTPIENYLLLPDTIINPDGKKEVGKWVKNKLGEWIYDASQAFIKEYDKWHVSTIKVDAQITPSGKKLIAFKNFYEDIKNREPYKNKRTIEDFWKNALSSSDSSRRHANISHAQKSQPSDIASTSYSKNQEKNDIRELERQERGNNPLVWASIVLAKDVLNGRQITHARLEKLLPGYKLDGSKYEYVKDRAQKIAETCRAKYLNAKRDIDQSLQLAESDYYWNSEQMEKIYDSFRKDGEAYGEAKQKIIAFPQCSKR